MALTSLYTGISGLTASSLALSVIGDNIANMNTTAYKSSTIQFGDVLSSSLTSGSGSSQIGRGVMTLGVTPDFSQGSFQTTSNTLDLALDGDGFFMVKDSTGSYYTRAGSFSTDSNSNIVNPDGLVVQGYMYDAAGNISGVLSDINLSSVTSSTQASSEMTISDNLDARSIINDTSTVTTTGTLDNAATPPATTPFDPADATSYNYTNSVTVHDSTGNTETVDMYYVNTGANTWNWYGVVPAASSPTGIAQVQNTGSLAFDPATGALTSAASVNKYYTFAKGTGSQSISMNFAGLSESAAGSTATSAANAFGFDVNNPAATSQFSSAITVYDSLGNARQVTAYFTKTLEASTGNTWTWNAVVGANDSASGVAEVQASGTMTFDNTGGLTSATSNTGTYNFGGGSAANQVMTLNFDNFTQFASSSETIYQTQNGFPAGSLSSLTISQDGVISGIFSNGQIKDIAKIALAKFTAPTALTKNGRNLYSESFDSGQAIIGTAQNSGLGRVMSNSLELSNVDLATQFVDMISAQRAFQANSRVISMTDQLLQEVVSLVR